MITTDRFKKKFKPAARPTPMRDPNAEERARAAGGGYNDLRPVRFARASELHRRYESAVKRRGNMKAWDNILMAYNRDPWKDKDGTILPNFGFLRSKVEDKLNSYTDYATERENWLKVTTWHGTDPQLKKEWSDHITHAINTWCIGRWEKKAIDMILACRDMCLFSKGFMVWLDDEALYPVNLAAQAVWPDSNAGMTADTFDTVHINDRMTANELYRKIQDPEATAKGWYRDKVLAILRNASTEYKDRDQDEVYLKYRQGLNKAEDEDALIDVIHTFVCEYPRREADQMYEAESKISHFIMVRKAHIPIKDKQRGLTDEDIDDGGYLYYCPSKEMKMESVLAIVAQSVCRNFYEDPSLAEQCYTSAKSYDLVMNRILQGIEDNMRIYLKSTSTDSFNKLKRMKHGQTTILEQGVDIIPQTVRRPIQEAMAALRMVSNESDSMNQSYQTGARDQTGGYKTAKQTELDFNVSLKMESASLKIFNSFVTFMVKELYRRFIEVTPCKEYDAESQKMFKEYLTFHKVPKEAYDPKRVKVESILDLGAASPAARLQAAQITQQALATPARSEGELQSKRDMIGAVHGVGNVDIYLPRVEVQTEEDWRIGMENDALLSPGGNPGDIPVLLKQLHLRHLPRHIECANIVLQKASQYFQNLNQFNPDDVGIHVKTIMDMMIGLDQVLAHSRAHIQISAQGASQAQQEELKGYANALNQLAAMQDKLQQAVDEAEKARLQAAQEKNGTDPKAAHEARMNDIEYAHAQRMFEIDTQKAISKGDQLQQQSAENAQTKLLLEVAKTQQEMALQLQRSNVETIIASRKQARKP